MALSYKKNSSDFMDVVMRELEVCLSCIISSRIAVIHSDWLLISSMQNFDLEGKEESADEEEEEEADGKADWCSQCVVGAE